MGKRQQESINQKFNPKDQHIMKMLSLFSGIGGFEKGFLDTGYEFESYWSENDKYASAVYKYNFPNSNELGDATKIKPRNLPDIDILTAGFPCQSFSIAGKRQGFKDVRGTLFYEIVRICKDKKPGILLLENVDGIISHDDYATIITIHTLLSDIGYKGGWVVYNSKNFGLPQNRSRCFFIYYFGKEPPSKVFFIGEAIKENAEKGTKKQSRKSAVSTIDSRYGQRWSTETYVREPIVHNMQPRSGDPKKGGTGHLMRNDGKTFCLDGGNTNVLQFIGGNKEHQGQRIYNPSGISAQITAEGGGQGAKTGLYAIPVLTPKRANKRQNGRRFKTDGEPAFTLNSQDQHGIFDGYKIRRLTPMECERLQGFPDNWTKKGNFDEEIKEISDTQRYKMCGNAVSTNVIKAIAGYLKQ